MTAPLGEGVIANAFTVFDESYAIDEAGQRNFLDALVDTHEVDAYFVRSGMGQMYTFEFDDVVQIAKIACDHLAGKGAVLVGAAGVWDRNWDVRPDPETFITQAVELSKISEDLGAAGVVHTMPEAIKPSAGRSAVDITIEYLTRISDAVKIPIFMYQPPGTDEAYRATPESVRRFMEIPRVKGIKISTDNAAYILDIIWATRGTHFGFINGAETALLAGLAVGSRAVIGQGACMSPKILQEVFRRFDAGDLAGALDAQRSTNVLVQKCVHAVDFYKRYLNEKGYRMPVVNRPTTSNPYWKGPRAMTDAEHSEYKALFENELTKYGAVLPSRA